MNLTLPILNLLILSYFGVNAQYSKWQKKLESELHHESTASELTAKENFHYYENQNLNPSEYSLSSQKELPNDFEENESFYSFDQDKNPFLFQRESKHISPKKYAPSISEEINSVCLKNDEANALNGLPLADLLHALLCKLEFIKKRLGEDSFRADKKLFYAFEDLHFMWGLFLESRLHNQEFVSYLNFYGKYVNGLFAALQ